VSEYQSPLETRVWRGHNEVVDPWCVDCGTETRGRGDRCRPCAMRKERTREKDEGRRYQLGVQHPLARKVSTVREIAPIEAAWLGAMVEREGSIGWVNSNQNQGGRLTPYLSLVNTSVEVIATMLRLVGDGNISLDAVQGRNGHRPVWGYKVNKQNSLRDLLPQLIPFLADKKERAVVR